jgi:predicted permease
MPRLLPLLLRCFVDRPLADAIAGDLVEERNRRRRVVRFAPAAEIWLWQSALAIALSAAAGRTHDALSARPFGGHPVQKLRSDLRHAWRAMRARPGATAATVLVLAIGVGLTSAMFALADPFLFKPLPYDGPDRLVVIDLQAENRLPGPFPTLEEWQARTDLFDGVSAYSAIDVSRMRLRLPDADALMMAATVDKTFFEVLGLPLSLPDDWDSTATGGQVPIVLLADADPRVREILDRTPNQTVARQDGGSVRLVGALPERFVFPRDRVVPVLSALAPLAPGPLMEVDGNSSTSRQVIARLAPGVTPEIVMSVLGPPESDTRAFSISVESLRPYLAARLEPLAMGAFLAGLLIVLVCAANVANLLLARGAFRAREFLTRGALGASSWDLSRLVLVELTSLTLLGVGAGLVAAQLALLAARAISPAEYLALGDPVLTARVVAFAGAVGALVMLAGLVPALAAPRLAPMSLLAHQAVSESRGVRALRFVMAAAQSAVAMILVAGAALLGRSFLNLSSQDTGFDGDAVVIAVSYPDESSDDALWQDVEDTIDRLRRVPGVVTAAAATGAMVDGRRSMTGASVNGKGVLMAVKRVTPEYFDAVGTPLVGGRALNATDRNRAGVVINERAAREFWPNEPALDRSVRLGNDVPVVGVVADALDHGLDEPAPLTLFTLLESPSSRMNYVVRTSGPADAVRGPATRAIVEANREAIVTDISTLGTRLATSVADRSFATLVLAFFATAGVAVCAAGLVGIVSFVVARRTREIAIRAAIGAEPRHVRRLVMRQALTAAVTGAAAGLAAGWWLSSWLESLVFGIEPGDWPTLALGAVVMLAIVTLASWLPARRALRLSPTIALRTE